MELIDPALDNIDCENWQASFMLLGTPGSASSTIESIPEPVTSPFESEPYLSIDLPWEQDSLTLCNSASEGGRILQTWLASTDTLQQSSNLVFDGDNDYVNIPVEFEMQQFAYSLCSTMISMSLLWKKMTRNH